ncbi:MAG: hypothetical protein WBH95_02780 [Caldicoprobacterales bacterium]
MRKKHLTYLAIILTVGLLITIFSFMKKDTVKNFTADIDPNPNAIRQYYYNSVPGLIRAEKLDMVKPIHKTFDIPKTNYSLKLDRIWYNSRNVFIFYHVENIDQVAYLGGYFTIDDNKQIKEVHPRDLIGTSTEKGFFFNNNFYSFLRITPVQSINNESDQQLIFKPILYLQDLKYDFDTINIDPKDIYSEETVEEYKLNSKIETEELNIDLYALEAGISYSKIYFTYKGSDLEIMYKIKAYIITDSGEKIKIDKSPILIDKDKSNYYIEIEPFNELPESFDFNLESCSVIGSESIQCTIDTSIVSKDKGIHTIKMPLGRSMNTDIFLETLQFKDNHVEVELLWDMSNDKSKDTVLEMEYIFSSNQKSLISNINNGHINAPNIVTIQNHFGKNIEAKCYLYPITNDDNIRLYCVFPLEDWQETEKIFISFDNITYSKKLSQRFEVLVTPA